MNHDTLGLDATLQPREHHIGQLAIRMMEMVPTGNTKIGYVLIWHIKRNQLTDS
jgi:hypothetical protein